MRNFKRNLCETTTDTPSPRRIRDQRVPSFYTCIDHDGQSRATKNRIDRSWLDLHGFRNWVSELEVECKVNSLFFFLKSSKLPFFFFFFLRNNMDEFLENFENELRVRQKVPRARKKPTYRIFSFPLDI